MPADAVMRSTRPVTHSELVAGLRALGVRTGCVLMVHTRMSAIGWVVGASETVVRALLEALGPAGTLLAYVGWNDNTCRMDEWPLRWQDAYRSERSPFDPLCSEADPQMGRVAERIRTWPGAVASGSHYRRMVAVGRQAEWLTESQPWDHAFGPGSPLAKLVQADGQILMLGAPLDRLTIIHHAESLVDGPEKRLASHMVPVRDGAAVVWREVRDHDTTTARGAFPYKRVVGDHEPFQVIGQLALEAGCGITGQIGEAQCHLFAARPLVDFIVHWLNMHFGFR